MTVLRLLEKGTLPAEETPVESSLSYHLYSLYLFTRNDFKIILYPQTIIGVCQALTGGLLTTNPDPDLFRVLARLPLVAFWNWINLLAFNLANQRLPNSIIEDNINKPWRPIAAGRMSSDSARRLLLALLPINIALSAYIGGFNETVAMAILTWMYNDLGGADENYITRNLINAGGFICHGSGSTIIAAGYGQVELNKTAGLWLLIIGFIIFSTLQVQDIPDMEGDMARGRRTFPLVHGALAARVSVAVGVLSWSVICPTFWSLDPQGYLILLLPGIYVAYRTLTGTTVDADQLTYKIWCLWLVLLYLLPLYKQPDVFSQLWEVCYQGLAGPR